MQLQVLNPFCTPCPAKMPDGFLPERYRIAEAPPEADRVNRLYPGLYEDDQYGFIDAPCKAGALTAFAHSPGLTRHVSDYFRSNPIFENWRHLMPEPTPAALERYQETYNVLNLSNVDTLIKQYGAIPPEGQVLFHGGQFAFLPWQYTSQRPLATSFCPGAAIANGWHLGKAFEAGYIDLVMLTVTQPKSRAYFFSHEDNEEGFSRKGHEREVLFETGAEITISERILIREDFPVGMGWQSKIVPSYLLIATIS